MKTQNNLQLAYATTAARLLLMRTGDFEVPFGPCKFRERDCRRLCPWGDLKGPEGHAARGGAGIK